MEVQTVGAQNQVQPGKSKNNSTSKIAGTVIGAAGGAYGGYALAGHMVKDQLDLATKYAAPETAKELMRKRLSIFSPEEFENYWKNNSEQLIQRAKDALKDVTKMVKKIKINGAVAGALAGSLLGLGVGALVNKLKNKNAAG